MKKLFCTPLLMELFKTQAQINAFVLLNLTDDQLIKFHKEYASNLKILISNFIEDNPGIFIIENDELKKNHLSQDN